MLIINILNTSPPCKSAFFLVFGGGGALHQVGRQMADGRRLLSRTATSPPPIPGRSVSTSDGRACPRTPGAHGSGGRRRRGCRLRFPAFPRASGGGPRFE